MSKELDRILKLIALTTSPNENEARNAAFLATKLIREHKIVLSDPSDARRVGSPMGTGWSDLDDFFRNHTPRQQPRQQPQPPPRQRPPPRPEPSFNRPTNKADFMGRFWRRYPENRFDDSFCRNCGKRIDLRAPVTWLKGEGSYHDECWSSSWSTKPQPPKPAPAPFTDEDLHDIFGD